MSILYNKYTRREFIKFCGKIAALLGGGAGMTADFAEAFMKITSRQPPVIWLTGLACSGDSVSLVYGDSPSLVPLLSSLVDLKFHPVLSVAQGELAMDIINQQMSKGGYVLCFEGAIPLGMPRACMTGGSNLEDLLVPAIQNAGAVIACGTCASYGGIPAANGETGAVSIFDFVQEKGLQTPVVRIPGCPMNSHRFTGTVAYFVAYGKLPKLDDQNRPITYYGQKNHDNCQRFQYFAQDKYVMDYKNDKKECLFRMGCRGPVTMSDCPVRLWNHNTSWCVNANTPCVGCAHPEWPWPASTGIYKDPFKVKPYAKII